MENFLKQFIYIALFLSCLLLLFAKDNLGHLGPDTIHYLQYSDWILSGSLFEKESIPDGAVVRTIGYPLLLSLARLVLQSDLPAAVFLLHALLSLATVLGILRAFSESISRTSVYLASIFLVVIGQQYFNSITTEWTAISILILAFICFSYSEQHKSNLGLFVSSICFGLATLVKAFLLMGVLIPYLFYFCSKKEDKKFSSILCASAGPALILVAMLVNLYRIGSFSLAPYTGRSLFVYASLIGKLDYKNSDSLDSSFFNQLNFNIQENTNIEQLNERIVKNFSIPEVIAKEQKLSLVVADSLAGLFAIKQIRNKPLSYLSLVTESALKAVLSLVPVFLIYSLFQLLKTKLPYSLLLPLRYSFYFCVITVVILTFIHPFSMRYITVLVFPFICFCMLGISSFYESLFKNSSVA